jgi:hypothetical protein
VKVFTTYLKPGSAPVLVPEAFSIGAALFGWLWFLAQRAWIPAALDFAIAVLLEGLRGRASLGIVAGLLVARGVFGRDLVRWSLRRRGYKEGPVVAARSDEAALQRLATFRPELLAGLKAAAL